MHLKTTVLLALVITGNRLFSQSRTVQHVIPLPAGFTRMEYLVGSFSHWVQNLPVKKEMAIKIYDGQVLESSFYTLFGVVDLPLLFKSDLEQCADYCMRFWAEYHKAAGLLDKLYLFDYNGNRKLFKKSKKGFKNFLKWAMAYANSYSLKRGCKKVSEAELVPGDMVVQNDTGGIGHASIIVDICQDPEGKKLYAIGYSYMPAQEFHIEKATPRYGKAGWFTLKGYYQYLKDFLNLGKPVLRRFD